MYEIALEGSFSAAHALRLYDGSLEPRHGHDFKVRVVLGAPTLDGIGVVADFEEIKPVLMRLLARYDGKDLNQHADFGQPDWNPSTENIARRVCLSLEKELGRSRARVRRVTVWETPDASATVDGSGA
ncbi:MAG: hypothetical protein MOGMAGMI_00798 [Candidatus Omnitrophica bacterium]|nr:hypothetical protein [Candidatus Omnitrophota bacterium]